MRTLTALSSLAVLGACSSDNATSTRTRPAASLRIVSGDQQSAMVDSQLPHPVLVRVTDAQGMPVQGSIVNFVVTSGHNGHVYGGAEQTDSDGVAQELWTLGDYTLRNVFPSLADSQVLEARAVSSATGAPELLATFHAIALPGPPFYMGYYPYGSGQNGSNVDTTFGATVTAPFTLQVMDRNDNPCTGDTVVFTVKPGSGTITGSSAVIDTLGAAVLGTWTLGHQYADTVLATVHGDPKSPYLPNPFVVVASAH